MVQLGGLEPPTSCSTGSGLPVNLSNSLQRGHRIDRPYLAMACCLGRAP